MHSSGYIASICLFLGAHLPLAFAQPAFSLNGEASLIGEHCYRLTSEQKGQSRGSIWSELNLDLRHAFEIRFAVNLGCKGLVGEGMALVFQSTGNNFKSLGCGGSALGFANLPEKQCQGIGQSLALEIDSKFSRGQGDIIPPHLAWVQNGNMAQPLSSPARIYNAGNKTALDCEYHAIRVTWKPSRQELQVFVEDQLRLSLTMDLVKKIFQGSSEVAFGFTAASSAQPNPLLLCVQSVTIEIDREMELRRRFEEGVGIYNNPQRERLTVDIRLDQEQYVELQLFDSEGKVVYEIPPHLVRDNQYYVNLPGLPSGIYFITVTNGAQRVSKKIVHIAGIRA